MAEGKALRTLLATFSVDTEEAAKKLEEIGEKIDAAKGFLAQLGETLLSAFSAHAVGDFLGEMIELGGSLNDMADKLGVATEELQQFQFAAGLVGVGAEESGKALQFLNKNIGEALDGNKGAAEAFAKLGLKLKDEGGNIREIGDLLPEVADAFADMKSDQERTAAAMQIFGKSGASLLPLLKKGSEELETMNQTFKELELGIRDDFISAADEAGDQIDILKLGFRSLKTRIALEVLPTITDLAKRGQRIIVWLQAMVRETGIVKYAWGALAIGAVAAMAKVAIGWAKTFGLITGNGGIVRSLLGAGYFGLIIAAIIALAIVFEDLYTFVRGGDSVIGDLIETLVGVGESQKVIDYLTASWEQMKATVAPLIPLFQILSTELLAGLQLIAPYLARFAAWTLENGIASIKLFVGWIRFAIDLFGSMLSFFGEGISKSVRQYAGIIPGAGDVADFGESMRLAGQGVSAIAARDPSTRSAGEVNDAALGLRDMHQTNRIEINVQGGSTNAETGRVVAGAVGGALTQARVNSASSMMRDAEDD